MTRSVIPVRNALLGIVFQMVSYALRRRIRRLCKCAAVSWWTRTRPEFPPHLETASGVLSPYLTQCDSLIDLLLNLQKALTRKDSLASAPRSSDSGRSLINSLNTATSSAFREASSMASMVKDSIGLESEHLCEAAMTTEAVMANRHSAADDPMIYLDPNPRVRHSFANMLCMSLTSCPYLADRSTRRWGCCSATESFHRRHRFHNRYVTINTL